MTWCPKCGSAHLSTQVHRCGLKIRVRERRNSSPKTGLRQGWTEYQVISRNRVLARFELLSQAQKEYPDAILSEDRGVT